MLGNVRTCEWMYIFYSWKLALVAGFQWVRGRYSVGGSHLERLVPLVYDAALCGVERETRLSEREARVEQSGREGKHAFSRRGTAPRA